MPLSTAAGGGGCGRAPASLLAPPITRCTYIAIDCRRGGTVSATRLRFHAASSLDWSLGARRAPVSRQEIRQRPVSAVGDRIARKGQGHASAAQTARGWVAEGAAVVCAAPLRRWLRRTHFTVYSAICAPPCHLGHSGSDRRLL